jgi:hypothetical protein
LTEHHAIKAYWGSRSIAPLILDLGTRPIFPQGKSPWYPLDRRLGEMVARASLEAVMRKIPSPCRVSNPRSSSP